MKKEISILLERRKTKKNRGKDLLENLWEKIYRGVLLVDFAEKSKSRRIKSESRRQFIVILITALEVYIGDLIAELIDKKKIDTDKLNTLPKRDLTLQEVIYLTKKRVTAGEIICAFMNFQNIEVLNKFLTDILKLEMNFLNYLKCHKFSYLDKNSHRQEINFESETEHKLDQLFNNRHNFVHDITFNNTPTYEYLNSSRELIINLAFSIEILANKFRHNRNHAQILEKLG